MAVLEKTHPVVARFKQRGQAIALIKRTLARQLSEAELAKFNANDLLTGVTPHDDRATRQAVLERLTKDQAADDTELASEAGKVRAKANERLARMQMDAAQRVRGNVPTDSLVAQRRELTAKIAELSEELVGVTAELSRRERFEELTKKLGVVTDTDRALLTQMLAPDGAASTAKVGTPGT